MTLKNLFLLCVFIVVCHGSQRMASGCPYCQMGADPEAYRFMMENHKGSFPLDSAISQYAAPPVSADLKAPPPPQTIVTTASELPKRLLVTAPEMAPAKASASGSVAPPNQGKTTRLADAGLLGLAGLTGFFSWRTRRRHSA